MLIIKEKMRKIIESQPDDASSCGNSHLNAWWNEVLRIQEKHALFQTKKWNIGLRHGKNMMDI
jgi:hypothetical protein